MAIFKTGSTSFNSLILFRFHHDQSALDALDVQCLCPALTGGAAPLHRLDVAKTLGDGAWNLFLQSKATSDQLQYEECEDPTNSECCSETGQFFCLLAKSNC